MRAFRPLIIFLFCFSADDLPGQYYYEVTSGIDSLYQAVWDMDFHAAGYISEQVRSEEPHNLLIHHIENYLDFTRILLTDDLTGIEEFRSNVKKRLENIKLGESSSPYFYYSQAEIYIQRSLIRMKNGAIIRAGWDINRANKLLRKCKQKFPEFRYVDKSLGVIHTLMGAVKGFRKTLIKVFTSLDGTLEQGINEVGNLYLWNEANQSIWSDEIVVTLALVQGHIQKNWKMAHSTLQEIRNKKKTSLLGQYLIAEIAYRAGRNDEVIDSLIKVSEEKNSFHYIDFLLGKALLNKQDSRAQLCFKRYINNHRGTNFIKAAYHKMAWYELVVNNNSAGYDQWMKECREVGAENTGEDEQAQLATQQNSRPHLVLLKTRLLFDGGYYQKALSEIENIKSQDLSISHKLEYTYRKARILQNLGKSKEALPLLGHAINIGKNREEYFACNAALQMAQIFYKSGEEHQATKYAKIALKLNPKERKKNLHQEAQLLLELLQKGH